MTDEIDALPAALWKLCIVTLLALPNYLQVLIQNLERKNSTNVGLEPTTLRLRISCFTN